MFNDNQRWKRFDTFDGQAIHGDTVLFVSTTIHPHTAYNANSVYNRYSLSKLRNTLIPKISRCSSLNVQAAGMSLVAAVSGHRHLEVEAQVHHLGAFPICRWYIARYDAWRKELEESRRIQTKFELNHQRRQDYDILDTCGLLVMEYYLAWTFLGTHKLGGYRVPCWSRVLVITRSVQS